MAVSWLVGKRAGDVNYLIAHRQHEKAVVLLREQLKSDGDNVHLRRTLADMLEYMGNISEATAILHKLADDFAEAGFTAKAVAMLKKIDRLNPGHSDVYGKLASILPKKERDDDELRRRQSKHRQAQDESQKPAEAAPLTFPIANHSGEIDIEIEGLDAQLRVDADVDGGDFEPNILEPNMLEPNMLASSLFAGLREDELLPLMKGLRLATYFPGDIIVAEGEKSATLFIVTSGRVKVFVRTDDGRYTKVRELSDGDFFGEISLLTDQPRTATITAATTCELLALDRHVADAICAAHPAVRIRLETFASQRLDSAEETAARAGIGNCPGEDLHA